MFLNWNDFDTERWMAKTFVKQPIIFCRHVFKFTLAYFSIDLPSFELIPFLSWSRNIVISLFFLDIAIQGEWPSSKFFFAEVSLSRSFSSVSEKSQQPCAKFVINWFMMIHSFRRGGRFEILYTMGTKFSGQNIM